MFKDYLLEIAIAILIIALIIFYVERSKTKSAQHEKYVVRVPEFPYAPLSPAVCSKNSCKFVRPKNGIMVPNPFQTPYSTTSCVDSLYYQNSGSPINLDAPSYNVPKNTREDYLVCSPYNPNIPPGRGFVPLSISDERRLSR